MLLEGPHSGCPMPLNGMLLNWVIRSLGPISSLDLNVSGLNVKLFPTDKCVTITSLYSTSIFFCDISVDVMGFKSGRKESSSSEVKTVSASTSVILEISCVFSIV